MSQYRKLAAIMFVDIAGYTSLMQDNENAALSMAKRLQDYLEEEVQKQGGKIIKHSGDGALCSFDSAIKSIRIATGLQHEMKVDPVVPLRIGIHQADVIFSENDVHGDGVNIASRLESLAVPGSILISDKVYDDIKNHKEIESVSLGLYSLKNVNKPIEIFAISNEGITVPDRKNIEGKGSKYVSDRISIKKRSLVARLIGIVALIILAGILVIPKQIKKQNARNVIIPGIEKLLSENFRPPTEAYDLGFEAQKYIPNDSALIKLWPVIANTTSIITIPEGAEVVWKDYDKPDSEWRFSGITPLIDSKFPRSYIRMEIRMEGYQTIEYAGPWPYGRLGPDIDTIVMDPLGELPENMARIPGKTARMNIVGLEQEGGKWVGEFLIDKFEVTNKEFKKFVDAGGYTNPEYWDFKYYQLGEEITVENALAQFIDKTERPGPANWEAGSYPEGLGDHPVTGISWYEAAAYASFVDKQLPTIFHWSVVAQTSRTEFIVPLSNFNGKSTVPVGSLSGFSTFGIYDLAGNAREWCFNESGTKGQRYILGGGWNDPTYAFNDSYTQPAMDRSSGNGFRCIKELPGDTTMASLKVDVAALHRDYRKEKPVDDNTFSVYLNQFVYDKNPLDPKVIDKREKEFWTIEKISFDAGYNNEKLQAWLFLPKDSKPPYQTIIFFPGSGDIYSREFNPDRISNLDFLLKGGRAIIWPVYKGTHERFDELGSDLPDETVFYKDHVIMWNKEIARTIDYLETRSDIQSDKIGYFGWSWGGYMGGIIPAVEKRIKAIVLNVGGMVMNKSLPEADQLNYLPRIKQPILMLNGKHDMFFPVESSQKPMFDLLGTSPEDKEIIIFDVGHLVPRTDMIKETLGWYDKYLGAARNP